MKYTIELTEKQAQELAELAAKAGLKKADVIRRAVRLLDVIVQETADGKQSLQLVDEKTGDKTKLRVELIN